MFKFQFLRKVESVLYGLYTALFAGSVYILASQRSKRYYFATSITLWVLTTTNLVFNFATILSTPDTIANSRLEGGATFSCSSEPETPERAHEIVITALIGTIGDVLSSLAQIAADSLLETCHLTADGPFACDNCLAYYESQLYKLRRAASPSAPPPPEFFHNVRMTSVFSTAGYALALGTTVVTTMLTAGRIWWVSKELKRNLKADAGHMYRSAIVMIVESGAIYSSGVLISLIVNQTAPNYESISAFAIGPLIGIAPTLIIVRVGMGHSFEETHAPIAESTPMRRTKPVTSMIRFATRHSQSDSDPAYETRLTTYIGRPSDGDSASQLEAGKRDFLERERL
ncbi:hypothetical protein EVG20_g7627 [Dentipellis fragilis]|uniref:Uncharacterized protein n=1 Tax=Dentipellis fragilis TaxID=205917 RepID=A0A4Y9YDS4_9AGAM|nr:hypothetical protein EVG20_g7627 [Dentipellis fragilis]